MIEVTYWPFSDNSPQVLKYKILPQLLIYNSDTISPALSKIKSDCDSHNSIFSSKSYALHVFKRVKTGKQF